ncbi:hypothetical protein OHX03_16280 [Acinetobacter baumannii]|nr:hypothetical protein [Acinetobacter baumannii]
MDKPMKFNEWLGTQGNMVLLHANCCRIAYEGGQQSQQAKVEELKATIKGNHGRIAELERLNRVKAQAILDLHQEIKELKAPHHGEVIGHEVHLKKIKQERDELQKRVDACQKLLNELKDAKAELVECDLYDKGVRCALYSVIQDLEQALKGGEA